MEEEEGGSGEGGVESDGRDGGWCRGRDSGRAAGGGALKTFDIQNTIQIPKIRNLIMHLRNRHLSTLQRINSRTSAAVAGP